MSWQENLYNAVYNRVYNSTPSYYNQEQKDAIRMISEPLLGLPLQARRNRTTGQYPPLQYYLTIYPRLNIPYEQSHNFIELPTFPITQLFSSAGIIIGPPGTGKTEVICVGSILYAFREGYWSDSSSSNRLFIVTFTNAGAMRIIEKFIEIADTFGIDHYHQGIKFVQAEYRLESINYQNYNIPDEILLSSSIPVNYNERTWRAYLSRFNIFVGTSDALNWLSNMIRIKGIIYDEASQLTIPKFFQVIPDNSPEFICAVGDDQQLPPVAKLQPLTLSPLIYLQGSGHYQNIPIPNSRVITLKEQFRMHPAISQLTEKILITRQISNADNVRNPNYFLQNYDNTPLSNALNLTPQSETILDDILKPCHTVVIIDTSDLDENINFRIETSRMNPLESEVISSIYKAIRLCYNDLHRFDIIMTSPYTAQVELIGSQSNSRSGTIHKFQGQESKVVLYSLTFADSTSSSFFTDLKLMYVGLSRAKKKLIIIGNREGMSFPDIKLQHIKNTIFNYSYESDSNYPNYVLDPVLHLRIQQPEIDNLLNELRGVNI
ncbi:MAG: AAA domain-containing protein [Candidatus Odinarchaeota archaeon]